MATLKDLRMRIASVKSTRKITSAMKMVAASKLRRAQDAAEAARPYAERMDRILGNLAASVAGQAGAPKLLSGSGNDQVHLLVLMTANRGLCGGFNGSMVRLARQTIVQLENAGKTVKVICIGRKGRDQLRRDHKDKIIATYEDIGHKGIPFSDAQGVATSILTQFEDGEFDVCTVLYNRFQSVIAQIPTRQQLIPFPVPAVVEDKPDAIDRAAAAYLPTKALYDYEPSEEGILAELLPRNVAMQIFRALLESSASEQGARMSAMDNATRNAGDMINKLALKYNRARQSAITSELIEIISGAEAL
ncbi:MAG: F0F1 ATP synthase subunit gamma [Alphaproteobacteria bacterium RIFOXYD12_FULL_60_8]|nr:MAG: F0F1 ATP synthase subunit gamma [Alphaproteobacteria bacterium RIFOXYD12_FULL_60_8]